MEVSREFITKRLRINISKQISLTQRNNHQANFKRINWELSPSSAVQTLVFVPPSGVADASAAPARYKGRITWTGDLSKSVASFVLLNVTPGDEEEYGIRIKFGPFDVLKDTVDLKVLGKCTCPPPATHTHHPFPTVIWNVNAKCV